MTASKLSAAKRDEVSKRYGDGESMAHLASEYGIRPVSICSLAIRRGIFRGRKVKLSPPDKVEIIRRYAAGEGSTTLAKEFGVKDASISNVVKKSGGKMRSLSEGCRRLPLREDAFAEITPESAYWAGFLMADGCITKRKTLAIGLSTRDLTHLVKLRAFLGSGHSISVRPQPRFNGHGVCKLEVNSSRIASDLARFGIVQRKTAREEVFALEMSRDFWRGFMDGDGSVGFWKTGDVIVPAITICGSHKILAQFKAFIRSFCPKARLTIRQKKTLFIMTLSGSGAAVLIRELYEGAAVALERKAEKAQAVMFLFPRAATAG